MIFTKRLSSSINKWEYTIPIFATLSLIISCIIVSEKKYFWLDELFSFYLVNDKSFAHMMVALSDKINNAPPLYFILGWLWIKLFSATELTLRLFSSLGMCTAFVIVWITLRRTYNFWSASIGTLTAFCLSSAILEQNTEARFYGLFIAVCSFGLVQFDAISKEKSCSNISIFLNICIHTAIIYTHVFGFLYSGAIFSALIIRDKYFKIFRPKVYLSIILSWLLFVPWISSFLNQADAGKPHSWVAIPGLMDLINSFNFSSTLVFFLLVLLTTSYLLFIKESTVTQADEELNEKEQKSSAENSLLILAYTFLAVPILSWIISRTVESIFVNRYIIPNTISWSILLTYLSSRILPIKLTKKAKELGLHKNSISKQRLSLLILTAVLTIYPIYSAKSYVHQELPGLNDDKYGYSELPIAVQSPHVYLPRFYYSPKHNRYFFILDWQAALDQKSSLNSTVDYKIMNALKRNYPEQNVVQSQHFLEKNHRFLVLDEDGRTWFEIRIKNDPKYRIKYLGRLKKIDNVGNVGEMNLLLVEKN